MDSKTYWHMVDAKRDELLADSEKRKKLYAETRDKDAFDGQPEDGSGLYLMTLHDPLEKNQEGGQFTCLPFRVAAQRIIERRHRLATAEEIKTFLSAGKRNYIAEVEKVKERARMLTGNVKPETPHIHVHIDEKDVPSRTRNAGQTGQAADKTA